MIIDFPDKNQFQVSMEKSSLNFNFSHFSLHFIYPYSSIYSCINTTPICHTKHNTLNQKPIFHGLSGISWSFR